MRSITQTRSGYVVVGVDTHKHFHVAAMLEAMAGVLATMTIPTDTVWSKPVAQTDGYVECTAHRTPWMPKTLPESRDLAWPPRPRTRQMVWWR